jgi:transcriptional regulator with XRE-family HTH domain
VNNNTLILEELEDLSNSEKTGHLKNRGYTMGMPRRSRLTLRPLQLDNETIGQRLARLRKERGCTQAEASEKIGIIQALILDYERDKVRLHAGMAIRFTQALEVTTDELLGVKGDKNASEGVTGLRLPRRTRKIEELPPNQQKTLLKTMDTL